MPGRALGLATPGPGDALGPGRASLLTKSMARARARHGFFWPGLSWAWAAAQIYMPRLAQPLSPPTTRDHPLVTLYSKEDALPLNHQC